MPNVMKQSGQTNKLQVAIQSRWFVAKFILQDLRRLLANSRIKKRSCVHYSKGMFEPCVHGARVHLICPSKLTYSTKALKGRSRGDFALPIIESNKAVYRTANFVVPMNTIQHLLQGTPTPRGESNTWTNERRIQCFAFRHWLKLASKGVFQRSRSKLHQPLSDGGMAPL